MNMCRICFFVFLLLLTVHVSAVTNYVWQGSPAPVAPYTSWKTAAHTIQDAVNAADPGNLVLVTNGVYATGSTVTPGYTVRNRLVADKTVTVQSVSGPAVTVISGEAHSENEANGSNAVRAVYLGPGAGLGFFGSLVAIIVVIIIVLLGLVVYPFRVLMERRRRKQKESAEAETAQ